MVSTKILSITVSSSSSSSVSSALASACVRACSSRERKRATNGGCSHCYRTALHVRQLIGPNHKERSPINCRTVAARASESAQLEEEERIPFSPSSSSHMCPGQRRALVCGNRRENFFFWCDFEFCASLVSLFRPQCGCCQVGRTDNSRELHTQFSVCFVGSDLQRFE